MLSSIPVNSMHSPPGRLASPKDYFSTPINIQPEASTSTSTPDPTQDRLRVISGSSSTKASSKAAGPSSLTLQLRRYSNPPSTQPSREVSPMRPSEHPPIPEMTVTTPSPPAESDGAAPTAPTRLQNEHRKISQHLGRLPMPEILPTDMTPLLSNASLPTYTAGTPGSEPIARPEPRRTKSLSKRFRLTLSSSIDQAKTATQPSFWKDLVYRVFTSLPAVFLGVLLNVLDGVSYGMIMFPAGKIFDGFGPMGVSLFFVT
jgi:hypothetical protein